MSTDDYPRKDAAAEDTDQEAARECRALVPLDGGGIGTDIVEYERFRIGALLLSDGKISSKGVTRVLKAQRRNGQQKFGELAVRLDLVTARDVQIALCRQLGYPSIEALEERLSPDLYMALAPFSRAAELLNKILAQILSLSKQARGVAIAVVSSEPGEGRSAFAGNLALAFAQSGRQTLLIDADMRRPRQHELFGIANSTGLSALAFYRNPEEGELKLVSRTHLFGLSIIKAGAAHANPIEILNSERFAALVEKARTEFDAVIIDTPPACVYADAEAIAAVAKRALIVTRAHRSRVEGVQELVQLAKRRKVKVLGAVLGR